MPFMEHDNSSRLIGSAASLLIMVVFGLVLSASCGSVREKLQSSNSTAASQPPDIAPQAIQTSPEALQQLIPCHIDLATAQRPRPAVEPTPETIRIQLLEHPHRIIPSNIVLRQNRWYKFNITAGNEWHSFRIKGMGAMVTMRYHRVEKRRRLCIPPTLGSSIWWTVATFDPFRGEIQLR